MIEDSRLAPRAPLAAVALDYTGAGAGTAYTVGHPEPLTLARTLGVRGRGANLMLLRPATAAYLHALRGALDRGDLTREAAAADLLAPPTGRALLAALAPLCPGAPASADALAPVVERDLGPC